MTEYQPSPRVVRKRKDVDRQQVRRNRMKATGTPTTHVLDRALVEGLMYQIDLQRVRGVDVKEMQISAQRVLAYATSILTAGTNGSDHYNVESVAAVIRKRIGQPGASKFRLALIPKEQRRAAALMSIEYAEDVEA
ncbi:hypothetical protein [Devosia ginsengisoli]|uniref:hypothetical protein n=1 Tax=Devosia ginsengisoli TaxID=400770 RepID=UPI0026F377E7|nr:hypothetical protein [Devosia ginsengisoli]MCR6671497.1 hypothetical protein [Devosia ginsengisoli]